MSLRVRTFEVRNGSHKRDDEDTVDSFLRSVSVDRIDSAYSGGSWQVFVLFHDTRQKEEAEQIASVIISALRVWRMTKAEEKSIDPLYLLPDETIEKVAHYVPTTAIELRVVMGDSQETAGVYAEEIVEIVRDTLNDLS